MEQLHAGELLMNVSLLSEIDESVSNVRQGLFTNPIIVSLSEEVSKSLRNAFYEAIVSNATSDMADEFSVDLGIPTSVSLRFMLIASIADVVGEPKRYIQPPYTGIVILVLCDGIAIINAKSIDENNELAIDIRSI